MLLMSHKRLPVAQQFLVCNILVGCGHENNLKYLFHNIRSQHNDNYFHQHYRL
jgi:hypothetical protein